MTAFTAIVFALFSAVSLADVPASQKPEIDHLLTFVQHTSCKINRNGKLYDGDDAVSHIKKKYAYFKDDIQTTEQFIELSATKSTMSGRYYTVQCNEDKQLRTQEWLLEELANYRENANG